VAVNKGSGKVILSVILFIYGKKKDGAEIKW
jgi:hypothetical protein